MAPWLHLALATALAGGAAAQGTTTVDNNYRIRTDLPPCPIGTDGVFTISDQSSFLSAVSQIDASYLSPPKPCEVTLTFTAASTVVGPYKLLTPLTLRGISLKMQLDNRLITNPQQCATTTAGGRPVVIEAPPGRRAITVNGNSTQLIVSNIEFSSGDLSAMAMLWASKKGYDYYQAKSDMASAAVHNNPLYEGGGNQASNPLHRSSYLGSNWGATGRDEARFPKQPAKTYYAGPDDDCDGMADRVIDIATSTNAGFVLAGKRLSSSCDGVGVSPSPSPPTGRFGGRAPTPTGRFSGATGRFSDGTSISFTDLDEDGRPEDFVASSLRSGGRTCTCGAGYCASVEGCPDDGGMQFYHEVRTAREAGSGLATGRRQFSAGRFSTGRYSGVASAMAGRDRGTGQATGRRQYMKGLSGITDATEVLRKSMSVIFTDREGQEVIRGPLSGEADPEQLIDMGDASAAAGGLIAFRNATGKFRCASFSNSFALTGGAIQLSLGSTLRCDACQFRACSAMEEGGAVALDGGSLLSLESSSFDACTADQGGAVSASERSRVVCMTTHFRTNRARRCGGALSLDDEGSMSLIEKSLFSDNKAMDGGAVCLGRLAVQDFVDSRFTSNSAVTSGGAIFSEPTSILRVAKSLFESSSAPFGQDAFVYGHVPYFTAYSPAGTVLTPSVEGPVSFVKPTSAGTTLPNDFPISKKRRLMEKTQQQAEHIAVEAAT